MPAADRTLDDLRQEIDGIDDALLDLIQRRTRVVQRIAEVKDRTIPPIRPAREAMILRRVIAQADGTLPKAALARIWREMVSALTRLQAPVAVAVFAPEERRGLWDLARDHFGSTTPMAAVTSPLAVLRAVGDGTATAGVVPFPEDGDADPWWRFASTAEESKLPQVIARLPFCGRGNVRSEDGDALVLAMIATDPTGDDHFLIRFEFAGELSRSRLREEFESVGLAPVHCASHKSANRPTTLHHLVVVSEFLLPGDPRLAAVAQRLGLPPAHLVPIGAYAVPIQLPVDVRKG